MAAYVAPKPVAGEQGFTTEERIAGSLEAKSLGGPDDLETSTPRPFFELRRFTLPDAEPKVGNDKELVEDQAGVGREDQVGKTRYRLDQVHGDAQLAEGVIKRHPLPSRAFGVAA